MTMTIKEAWDTMEHYLYKCDVGEYAANCSEEDGELYEQAEAQIKALVEANS